MKPLTALRVVPALLVVLSAPEVHADPGWWNRAPTRIWESTPVTSGNAAPVTAGQLKFVALQAKKHLDTFLYSPGLFGAGPEIDRMIEQFPADRNSTPVSVRELKAVAGPFWKRLAEAGLNTAAMMTAAGCPPSMRTLDYGVLYPWLDVPEEHGAMATIGQLKLAFSFEVVVPGDYNFDGMPDAWQAQYGWPAATADTDGDGLTSLQESRLGTNPNSTDTDGDGVSDADELAAGTDPARADSHPPVLHWIRRAISCQYSVTTALNTNPPVTNREYTCTVTGFPVTPPMEHRTGQTIEPAALSGKYGVFPAIIPFEAATSTDLRDAFRLVPPNAENHVVRNTTVTTASPYQSRVQEMDAAGTRFRFWLEQKPAATSPVTRLFAYNVRTRKEVINKTTQAVTLLSETNEIRFLTLTIPAGRTASDPADIEPPWSNPAWPEDPNLTHRHTVTLSPINLPIDITACRRGTIREPGPRSPDGIFGRETVLLENADHDEGNANQRDCDTAAIDLDRDDDLVKIELHYPAGQALPGVGLRILHQGIKIDGEKANIDEAMTITGESRLNFYDEQGRKMTENDLQIAELVPSSQSFLGNLVRTGSATFFIEGADRFGMVGAAADDANAARFMGGALIRTILSTPTASHHGPQMIVMRGGYLSFRQRTNQPGTLATLEFRDGIGRISASRTDAGNVIRSWNARSGKIGGDAYDVPNRNGHIPPGWRYVFERYDFTPQQRNQATGTGVNLVIRQGPYCRWYQDDYPPHYTTEYLYQEREPRDVQIGRPIIHTTTSSAGQTIMFKFQTEVIPPTSPAQRSEIQFHPDGFKDGTAGCIGIQGYDDCLEFYRYLHAYHQLKLLVTLIE